VFGNLERVSETFFRARPADCARARPLKAFNAFLLFPQASTCWMSPPAPTAALAHTISVTPCAFVQFRAFAAPIAGAMFDVEDTWIAG